MRIRDVWFDLGSFLLALIFAQTAGITMWNYANDGVGDTTSARLLAGIFAFLAYLTLRISLRIGNDQKRARERWNVERRRMSAPASDMNHRCDVGIGAQDSPG